MTARIKTYTRKPITWKAFPKSNLKDRDLSKILIRKQNRNINASKSRDVVAVDVEADDGNIFLIADSNGKYIQYPNITFKSIADFLLKYEGKNLFFHSIHYDAGCILKLLPEDILHKGYSEMKFEYDSYIITYIEKKKFTISKGKHSVSCFDIAQYYDNISLVKAYRENINKPLDCEYLLMKDQRKHFSLRYFLRNKKKVRQYCIRDCQLTKELAENWIDIFYKTFHFYPANWISSGYLAEKVLIHAGIAIPYFNEIPYHAQDIAWKAFIGGRFELIKKGHIGKAWMYDLNSAYPYALSKLPNLLQGEWIESLGMIHPKVAIGFFHILAHVDDDVKVAPFPFKTRNKMTIYPTGDFETYVTLEELKMVEGDPKIRYNILDSAQFIPDKDCTYPFKRFIETKYYERLDLKEKGNSLERAIKIVLNAMYGKMAQRVNNKIGNIFSAVIVAYITGYTRAQLYKFVKENHLENHVVAFATDSVTVTKEVPGLNSSRLGEMKLDKTADDVIFLSNGYYRFNGKWKQRGVGYDKEKKIEIEHQDTKIGKDGQLYIDVKTTKTTHIKGGIKRNKIDLVGKIEEYEKKIDLNSDRKRVWSGKLKSLHEKICYDSAPININMVEDILVESSDIVWKDEVLEEKYEPESDL